MQWGKCLQVQMRIDATKRLVRGKKITIDGGERWWVNFKYERLPNFCYRCNLLNHALTNYIEGQEHNSSVEVSFLQYGAWLRGELVRRGRKEIIRPRARSDAKSSPETTKGRTIKSLAASRTSREETGVGKRHVSEKTTL